MTDLQQLRTPTEIIRVYDECNAELVQLSKKRAQLQKLEAHKSISSYPCQPTELTVVVEQIHVLLSILDDYRKILNKVSDENFMTFVCADSFFIERATGVNSAYKEWSVEGIKSCSPSSTFKEIFEENIRVFSMSTKVGRRTYLDLFLRDILGRQEFSSYFRVFFDLQLSAVNESAQLWGLADILIGSSNIDECATFTPKELRIVAVEASLNWSRESYWECVAAAAALHKLLEGGEGSRNVWGILCNGERWQFIFIDDSSHLWTSKVNYLDVRQYNESDVDGIYRMIYHIVTSCFAVFSDKR